MKKALTQSKVDSLDYATTLRDPSLKGFVLRVYPPNQRGENTKSYGLITKSNTDNESFTPLSEEFRDATKVPLAKAYREAARLLLGEAGAGGLRLEKELARLRREVEDAN